MSEAEDDRRPGGQLFDEAAHWFARMRGPNAARDRAEFEAWLARGALHRGAYNRAAEIFAMGKVLRDEEAPGSRSKRPRLRGGARAPIFAIMLAGAAAACWLVVQQNFSAWTGRTAPSAQRQTAELAAAGAARQFRLGDGSLVRLQQGAHLTLAFSPAMRRLALQSGQARFMVAHEARPFVVDAGGGSVTAQGTVFDVALLPGRRVAVRLIAGIVDVRYPRSARLQPGPERRLRPGEATSFLAADEHATGAENYDDVRLSELVAKANRASPRHIVFADPLIGEQRVSGRFRIGDVDALAERIATLFDLAVDRRAQQLILRPG